jgi:hypothetical protein
MGHFGFQPFGGPPCARAGRFPFRLYGPLVAHGQEGPPECAAPAMPPAGAFSGRLFGRPYLLRPQAASTRRADLYYLLLLLPAAICC